MFANVLFGLAVCCSAVLARPEDYPPPELHEFTDPLHDTCTKLHGVSDDEVKNYVITDKSKKMMCYIKCLMMESKWGRPDESINYDFIIETAHPKMKDILLPNLEKCRTIPDGNEDCEKSYNFVACLANVDPAHFFLP